MKTVGLLIAGWLFGIAYWNFGVRHGVALNSACHDAVLTVASMCLSGVCIFGEI
jgi:hypothetical protein